MTDRIETCDTEWSEEEVAYVKKELEYALENIKELDTVSTSRERVNMSPVRVRHQVVGYTWDANKRKTKFRTQDGKLITIIVEE